MVKALGSIMLEEIQREVHAQGRWEKTNYFLNCLWSAVVGGRVECRSVGLPVYFVLGPIDENHLRQLTAMIRARKIPSGMPQAGRLIEPLATAEHLADFIMMHGFAMDLYEKVAANLLKYSSLSHLAFRKKVFAKDIPSSIAVGQMQRSVDENYRVNMAVGTHVRCHALLTLKYNGLTATVSATLTPHGRYEVIIDTIPPTKAKLKPCNLLYLKHAMMTACGHCASSVVKLKACSGCNSIAYCSKKCQKAAFGAHKIVCKKLHYEKYSSNQPQLPTNQILEGQIATMMARLLMNGVPDQVLDVFQQSQVSDMQVSEIASLIKIYQESIVKIAVSPPISSHTDGVMVLVERDMFESISRSVDQSKPVRQKYLSESVAKTLKLFFKRIDNGSANISPSDIALIATDAIIACRLLPGVKVCARVDDGHHGPFFVSLAGLFVDSPGQLDRDDPAFLMFRKIAEWLVINFQQA